MCRLHQTAWRFPPEHTVALTDNARQRPSPAIIGRLRRQQNAPLIVERAAARGRLATEGGDERAWVKGALSVRSPASRIESNGGKLDPSAATRPPKRVTPKVAQLIARCSPSKQTLTPERLRRTTQQGRARSSRTYQPTWEGMAACGHGAARTARPIGLDEHFASAPVRLRRRPRRAAHRRTSRTARAHRDGMFAVAPAYVPHGNARGERRDHGRARSS